MADVIGGRDRWLVSAAIVAAIGGALPVADAGLTAVVVDVLAGAAFLAVGIVRLRTPSSGVIAYVAGLAWFGANWSELLALVHRPLLIAAVVDARRGPVRAGWGTAAVAASAVGALLGEDVRPLADVTAGAMLAVVAVAVTSTRRRLAVALMAVATAGPAVARLIASVSPSATAIERAYALVVAGAGGALLLAEVRRARVAALADRVVELTEVKGGDVPALVAAIEREDPLVPGSGSARALAAVTELFARNRALQAELADRVEQVRASRRRLVVAGDLERSRLARRVAEGAGLRLGQLEGALAGVPVDGRGGAGDGLVRIRGEARAARDELDDLARGLHPRLLHEQGLAAALEDLAARAGCQARARVPAGRFAETVETTIWYVCAEAVANVAKHAVATGVDIEVDVRGSWIVATITDDGRGGAELRAGGGLAGLRDRVEAVGGHFEVAPRVPRGTTLRARVPLA